MKTVVIVDDDARTRRVLEMLVEGMSLTPRSFARAGEALEDIRRERCGVVLTDLRMPEMDGLAFMRALREIDQEVPVIVLTAYATVDAAVEAMKLGALDFVSKPLDAQVIEPLVARALEDVRRRRENRYWRQAEARGAGFEEMVGESPAMQRVFDLVRKVAPAPSPVLITGETGTGKELVARAIHRLGGRENGLFVPLNCSAIPGELLESELFGHVRGSFSGAHADRVGRFEAADGGTLFLDEIGDMELRLQAKLLRVLQEGVVEPVGANRLVRVDVRVVSSTNRDLEADVAAGRFREDLFYRLNVLRIELPPLRDRPGDVSRLAVAFASELGRTLGRGPVELTREALERLAAHDWPGNVRELRNAIERAVVLTEASTIGPELVELPERDPEREVARAASGSASLAAILAKAERDAIVRALAAEDDHKARTAARLGIGERTLWTKLKKHGLLGTDRTRD